MNSRTLERVERWESRPFSGGYEGLRDLAGTDFTGAVETAGTWLFMLNGRIVGVHDGTLDAFEDASGTAYVAPEPALPLLFTMWEGDSETRAKYYTEDTPISEVDDTLTSGSFTGYLELSENVLSGDYFVVYYGGRSMSAAFVGSRAELLGDDEAFERANDEVGIYEVVDAEVTVTEIPEPEPAGPDSPPSAETGQSAEPDRSADSTQDDVSPTDSSTAELDADPSGAAGTDRTEETDEVTATEGSSEAEAPDEPAPREASEPDGPGHSERRASPSATEPAVTDDGGNGTDSDAKQDVGRPDDRPASDESIHRSEPEASESAADRTPTETDEASVGDTVADTAIAGDTAPGETAASEQSAATSTTGERETASNTLTDEPTDSDVDGTEAVSESGPAVADASADSSENGHDEDPIEAEADWREATVIPSLDPARTAHPTPEQKSEEPANSTRTPPEQTSQEPSTPESSKRAESTPTPRESTATAQRADERTARSRSTTQSGSSSTQQTTETVPKERLADREQRIDELESEIEQLESATEELRAERNELAAENESLADTIEGLEGEVERLRSERDELESALEAAGKTAYDANQQLQPAQAISGTNLFVRYGSKGEATLESAHGGQASAQDVNANLQLERHTTFDASSVAVEGEPYDSFLDDTLEMQFVDWVIGTLLYEIQDTGNRSGLSDLYDAIPEIDRIELDGEIDLTYREAGEEVTEVAAFDVVLRNRMGEPLIVADLSDSRDPAGERMLVELEEDASRVKENAETLSAAFLVTSSFFEPGALEAASEATSGSFLSRDSRMSFIKQSRKQGYHLCLVEARGDEFHLNVPEL